MDARKARGCNLHGPLRILTSAVKVRVSLLQQLRRVLLRLRFRRVAFFYSIGAALKNSFECETVDLNNPFIYDRGRVKNLLVESVASQSSCDFHQRSRLGSTRLRVRCVALFINMPVNAVNPPCIFPHSIHSIHWTSDARANRIITQHFNWNSNVPSTERSFSVFGILQIQRLQEIFEASHVGDNLKLIQSYKNNQARTVHSGLDSRIAYFVFDVPLNRGFQPHTSPNQAEP